MRPHRGRIVGAALAACWLWGCGGGGGAPSSQFGLATRVPVAPLPLPTGLPNPQPVQLQVAFPALVFDRPLCLVAPPDGTDRLAVVEQAGRIRMFANDPATATAHVFLDIRAQVQSGGEEGLLGLAFHPDYATNGWFYVCYTRGGPRRSVLSRFTVSAGDANTADPASEVVLLEIEQPFSNHNGGALAFGPDGKLYVSSGDGGSGNDPFGNGQSLTTLLGKVLRLEADGAPVADNPFVGTAGARPEIWAYGLRNPWRMAFDRATGRLWLGDVGQGDQEEVDLIERGGNYGWRIYEGTKSHLNPAGLPPSAFVAPVHSYGRDQGASVTGGTVYRGSAVPALQGAYVYGDFVSGRVWALVHDGVQAVQNTLLTTTANPAAFGEDAAGEVYVCCFDGFVRRFVPTPGGGPVTAMPPRLSATGLFADLTTLTPVPGVLEYEVNAPFWSDGADKRRWLALPGPSRIVVGTPWQFPIGTALVKHFDLEVAPGTRRRLETRVLLHHDAGWQGYTYRWDAGGVDADLVDDAGTSAVFDVVDATGAVRQQTWTFPSRAGCLACHTAAAGRVLGLSTAQLNRSFAFPLRVDNQLRTWNHIGLFTTDIGDPSQLPALPDPHDAGHPTAERARAWLDVNCAMCHRPGGPVPVDLDLRHGTATAAMQLVGVPAAAPVPGGVGVRVTAGQHAQSDLWQRIGRRDAFAMPPLGSHVVDQRGLVLVQQWIDAGPP
ncbi:MAG: PQQ-dependent sugar dehydrogenase [Planctomycetes bacterium]|nr:PQQ-dependent sugar dehydrogenase [Planctomycetota bacterium]